MSPNPWVYIGRIRKKPTLQTNSWIGQCSRTLAYKIRLFLCEIWSICMHGTSNNIFISWVRNWPVYARVFEWISTQWWKSDEILNETNQSKILRGRYRILERIQSTYDRNQRCHLDVSETPRTLNIEINMNNVENQHVSWIELQFHSDFVLLLLFCSLPHYYQSPKHSV